MIQRFIELGEGYADIYELMELGKQMPQRVQALICFNTVKNDQAVASLAIAMKPTTVGNFQPIYISLEGVPYPKEKQSQRYTLFEELATSLDLEIISLDVKPSNTFHDKEVFYNHLIGILRMNRIIPPLS